MTPEQIQNYRNWYASTLAQAAAGNYDVPLTLNQGATIVTNGWGATQTLGDGDNLGSRTWNPSSVSPLTQAQLDSAMQYAQQSSTEDFVDFMGRVISPGTKINVNDPTTNQALGYYLYSPTIGQYEDPSYDPIMAGDSGIFLSPDSYIAYTDPNYYIDNAGIYTDWTWNPTDIGASSPARTYKDMWAALQGAGIAPYEEWGGTIGKGGWNALSGIFNTLVAPALGAGINQAISPLTESAMVGLSEATGLAPATAESIVNAGVGTLGGAAQGAITSGGDPYATLAGGMTGGINSAVNLGVLQPLVGIGTNYLTNEYLRPTPSTGTNALPSTSNAMSSSGVYGSSPYGYNTANQQYRNEILKPTAYTNIYGGIYG